MASILVWLGAESTEALLVSQVLLSLTLHVPMVALVIFTSRRDIMGSFTASPLVRAAAMLCAAIVLGLNGLLLLQTFHLALPGLAPNG